MIQIRNEEERDYPIVEEITRKAFYNMYMPGCVEHYLVHIMRGHEDFIPELDLWRSLTAGLSGILCIRSQGWSALRGKKRVS